MNGSTVLIVDDEQTLARSAKAFLADHGYEAEVAPSGERALELLERLQPDVVFADVRLPGMSGIDLLKRIREFDPVLPVIMLTAYGSIEGAVEAVKLGAFDYVKKPVDLEELKLLADRARENRLLKQELSYYRRRATRDVGFATMVGESPAVHAVLERARQIAALEDTPPVLLTGETGTGKGILAHAIHAAGPRAAKPFIEVNCTALPANLMEAELFGYERGAFTDAKESKPGLVEAAEGGFLFLDEIGDVDLAVQGKLLRAIEERTVRRVGSVRERKVDVRIVAATNRSLEREVEAGRFRADLRFRLDVIRIAIPPLRDRAEDVPGLVRRLWPEAADRVGSRAVLGDDVIAALARYDWPGNVRELQNVHASLAVHGPRRGRVPAALLPARIAHEASRETQGFDEARVDFERRFVRAALARAGGRRSVAAVQLRVSRQGLTKIMKRLGIE